MSEVFLAGPLAWPPLLEIVAGWPVREDAQEASLPDAALAGGPAEGCFPSLVAVRAMRVEGRLVSVQDAALFNRIAFFAAVLGRVPVPRHVETRKGRCAAVAFMAEAEAGTPAAAPWQQDSWEARWGGVARSAANEIMGYFGTQSPQVLHGRLPMILARAAAREAAAQGAPTELRSAGQAGSVRETACETSHAGFFLTRVHGLRHPGFDGALSPPLQREVFVATDAALVLPYDPVRDRVLLVEQFRMGPYGRGDPLPWVLEPVAGRVDAGETPWQAAHRECAEESGLVLDGLEHMTSHYCSPGCSTEFFHCYLGLADLPEAGQGHGGLDVEHEDIRTHVIEFDRAMALVTSGEVNVGPLVLMLLWLQRERPRLRAVA